MGKNEGIRKWNNNRKITNTTITIQLTKQPTSEPSIHCHSSIQFTKWKTATESPPYYHQSSHGKIKIIKKTEKKNRFSLKAFHFFVNHFAHCPRLDSDSDPETLSYRFALLQFRFQPRAASLFSLKYFRFFLNRTAKGKMRKIFSHQF